MSNQIKMKPLVEMEANGEADASTGGGEGSGGPGGGPGFWEKLKSSPMGKVLLGVLVLGAAGLFAFQFIDFYDETQPDFPRIRIMNPDTGELRWFQADYSKPLPDNFFYVEYCFDKTCGPAGGTPVVLNSYRGIDGPTKCPECGSEVVGHNPRPEEYMDVDPADWSN